MESLTTMPPNAIEYMEKHDLPGMMETLFHELVTKTPEDPIDFLIEYFRPPGSHDPLPPKMTPAIEKLLSRAKIPSFGGLITLQNHMVMAPLMRCRADAQGVVGDLQAAYYKQRASAGLIVSEGTSVSAMGKGHARVPGIYTKEQIEAWKKVVDAVHSKGSYIFLQLYHTGRVGHSLNRTVPDLLVAPSGIKASGQIFTDQSGLQDFPTPKALDAAEIPAIVQEFATATRVALDQIGFDGVEFQAGSGYLAHQFLSAHTNKRTDQYGGSIENRIRFTLECMEAILKAAGTGAKVGIKLSPVCGEHDIDPEGDHPEQLYAALVKALAGKELAYVHVQKPAKSGAEIVSQIRKDFKGTLVVGGGFKGEDGGAAILKGEADLIAYGSLFAANPDLPFRFKENVEVNAPDAETYYTAGEKGYTDYPTYKPK